jgi:hypothetical protein
MAERRLCSRRVGRSPLEDDLRRLGVPRSSEVMSWKTLERLRVEAAASAESGPRSSVAGGRWKVNLRPGGETVTGSDPTMFGLCGTMITPEDPVVLTKGDGCGVSRG